jgi:hypothetical protein
MWIVERDHIQPDSKHIISSTKTTVSAHFCRGGFVSIEFLPDGQKYNSLFSTEIVLPSIERKFAELRRKLRVIPAHLHIDNARPHTSKISVEKIEELRFIRVITAIIHPTSCHVTSPCLVTSGLY